MSLEKAARSSLPVFGLLCLVGLSSCASEYSVRLSSPTTELTTARTQMSTAMGNVSYSGFEVDTVGNDTVVTRFLPGTVRRFVIKERTGYKGEVAFDFVNLIFEGMSVWIDDKSIKVHSPDGSSDVLIDRSDENAAGHGDFVIDGTGAQPVAVDRKGPQPE